MTALDDPRATAAVPLDRGLTERAARLVAEGTTQMSPHLLKVPLQYYRDPEILAQELDLLRRTPLAVAPSAQVSQPHAYVVREVLGSSLLVTGDGDGAAHVLLNYCRHRGASPASGSGVSRRFTCPYHAWSYDTKGCLVSMPGKKGFDGMDRDEYGLVELPAEERHGFIWAVLDRNARLDLDEHLGSLGAELEQWNYSTYGYLTEREFSSEVSWKNALEAFAESYHFPFVHGESLIGMNAVADCSIHDAFGRHHRMGFPFTWIRDLEEDGDWSPQANMGVIYWIYPNLILANSPVGVEIIDMLPEKSPTSCTVRHSWMGITPAEDEFTTALYHEIYEQVHAAVRDEDFAVLPGCGAGVRAGQHDHMLIGKNEVGVQHMIEVMAKELGIALTRS